MVKAVLFDFDGTIVDSLKHIVSSWRKAFALQNISLTDDEIIHSVLYAHQEERVQKYHIDGEKLHADYHHLLEETFANYEKHEHTKEALSALDAQGILLAIVTSGKADKTREILRAMGLEHLFATILGGNDAPRPKPYPDIALKAMQLLNVQAADTVLIGDSATDMQTGKNAGVRTGLYTPTINAPYMTGSLEATLPAFEFSHYRELTAKLAAL